MPRLLLIDDDEPFRETVSLALAAAGHAVIQASGGRQALTLFRREHIDLVVTDIVMPGGEGIETIMAFRRERPTLPIVAISGVGSRAELYLRLASKLGAGRVLTKPFRPGDLLRAIDELLLVP